MSGSRAARVGLYSDSAVIGGAERSLLNLVKSYRGNAELVLCSPSEDFLSECASAVPNARTHLVSSRKPFLQAVLDHRKAFLELELDLLQVTLCNPFTSRPALFAGYSRRIPTIAVEQLVLPSQRRRGRLLKYVTARPLAAHVSVGSASADVIHELFGLRRSSITVIHNGVPDEVVEPISFSVRPVVGCAARHEDQKRVDLLLDAVAELDDVRAVIVGDGSRRRDLERQAAMLGVLDRVEFVGWTADARPHIAGFDVFVLPSRDEAFPLTIVEAMFNSTPVVATDVGSVREAVIDGVTGLLVPPDDVAALVAAVRRILDEPGLRVTLTANALALATERFTARAMAEAYDRLWTDVLARRRARPESREHPSPLA
jgi:glycosyltransferase involved in cell wall biosynthesis